MAPKKSATAKPKAGEKKKVNVSAEEDSDSDPFGDYSLPKLAAKAQQAKKAAMAASSSPGSQASPSVKPSSTPTTSTTTKSSTSLATSSKSATSSLNTVDKYKSIFSESSESDSEVRPTNKKKSATTAASKNSRKKSPPRVSPTKSKGSGAARLAAAAAAKKAAASKMKSQPKKKSRGRAASTDSISSATSDSDMEVTIKKPAPKTTPKSTNKKSASASKTPQQKKKPEPPPVAKTSILGASSDSDTTEKAPRSTRRQTRGANVRKSKFLTGKNYADSESETEGGQGNETPSSPRKRMNSTSKSDVKQANGLAASGAASLLPVRRDLDGLSPMEERKCPVSGCDSSGHLNGRLDRHFTAEACPVYHNTTKKWCQSFRSDVTKKSNLRKKALHSLVTKSPLGSPNNDQKRHAQHVKDERSKFRPDNVPETDEIPDDRELKLEGFASEWDLQLFREAQAAAAEDHENTLKGLPDTKQPRYIEMGRHEMEVWYQSPYPEEYSILPKLYICEFCLKYLKSATQLRRHAVKCVWNHPPGDEIYRKEPISVFEICGKRYKQVFIKNPSKISSNI